MGTDTIFNSIENISKVSINKLKIIQKVDHSWLAVA